MSAPLEVLETELPEHWPFISEETLKIYAEGIGAILENGANEVDAIPGGTTVAGYQIPGVAIPQARHDEADPAGGRGRASALIPCAGATLWQWGCYLTLHVSALMQRCRSACLAAALSGALGLIPVSVQAEEKIASSALRELLNSGVSVEELADDITSLLIGRDGRVLKWSAGRPRELTIHVIRSRAQMKSPDPKIKSNVERVEAAGLPDLAQKTAHVICICIQSARNLLLTMPRNSKGKPALAASRVSGVLAALYGVCREFRTLSPCRVGREAP